MKDVKEMLKLGFVLAMYATAACVGLAFVYTGTSAVISERQKADLEASLQELFPRMDAFEDVTDSVASPDASVAFQIVYEIRQSGEPIGLAIQASGASYGGPIKILTGVGTDAKITRVKVLEHADTPGLGANAASPAYYVDKAKKITFTGQFSEKSASHAFTVKEDVIAITASTITSRAVANVVKASAQAAAAYLGGYNK
ncbi:MAG: FMN-binding protein [Treponema sp.]|jgi:electron transport complex protein RnfG|nr:FMN-binding protein [Treponema sp.]